MDVFLQCAFALQSGREARAATTSEYLLREGEWSLVSALEINQICSMLIWEFLFFFKLLSFAWSTSCFSFMKYASLCIKSCILGHDKCTIRVTLFLPEKVVVTPHSALEGFSPDVYLPYSWWKEQPRVCTSSSPSVSLSSPFLGFSFLRRCVHTPLAVLTYADAISYKVGAYAGTAMTRTKTAHLTLLLATSVGAASACFRPAIRPQGRDEISPESGTRQWKYVND